MDHFGFDDRIIDNVLDQHERQLFYLLQEKGLLTAERELFLLSNGRTWRIHYWLLSKSTICEYAQDIELIPKKQMHKHIQSAPQSNSIYTYLPPELWVMRKKITS
jgi:hypothetical protein